ncbi:MAG: ethylbenzene dehydrogenase-related protein [Halorhabdus sp.]
MRSPSVPTPDWRAALGATVMAGTVVLAILALQGVVTAAFTSGTQPMAVVESVPQQSDAAAWEQAPSRTVSLQKQQMAVPFGGGSVDELTVEALTNESHVAFRLTWNDPTNDTSIGAPGTYSDAAAIMLHSGSTPPITMGAVGTPVNIWYWRASWQFGEKSGPWSGDMYTYPHQDNLTKPGRAVGNPLSKGSYEQFAQNYYAKGFGSLTHAPVQPVTASATRSDGQWQVTFVRERGTDGRYDAAFNDSEPMYLAFAVWNGSANEVNGQKSITLQFTKLEVTNASLMAANPSGGTSGGGTPAEETTGSPLTGVGPWVAGLVGATLFTWLVAYRRMEP